MLLRLQYFAHITLILTELCHYSLGSAYLYSNNIRCLKTPAGTDLVSKDCQSSGTFPFPYGNELGELWTYHYYRKGCFKFHHGGCIPSSPNWFYSEESCLEICDSYINQNGENQSTTNSLQNKTDASTDGGMNVTTSNSSLWYMNGNMTRSNQSTAKNGAITGQNTSARNEACRAIPAFGSCPNYQRYDMVLQKWFNYPEKIKLTYRHGSCVEYIYSFGNCGANENRFETVSECETSCAQAYPPCEQMPFREGDLCEGRTSMDFITVRFSYNGGICFPFQFSGCGGNQNNFATRQECETICANGENTWPRSAPQNPSWHLPYLMIENDKDGKWKLASDLGSEELRQQRLANETTGGENATDFL